MADQRNRDGMEQVGRDATEGAHIGFVGAGVDEQHEAPAKLETHVRHSPHDAAHIDLQKDEYTPDEVARMIGTSRDAVMHAIYEGDLKAEREGNSVVCISHAAVVDWMRRRGPGV